jgi:integrase
VDPQRTGLYIEVRATSPGQGTYYLRYKDATGKTCHQKIGRTGDMTLAAARGRCKELKAEIQLGADPRGEHKAKKAVPTLAAFFADSYMPHVKPRKRSWAKDQALFTNRIEAAFGHVRLNELRRQELQVFHSQLLTKGIGEATADHHIKLIRQVLNKAVEFGVIEVNPIARIRLFNPDNRLENYLGGDELEGLLKVLRTHKNRPVCNAALFLLSTGARLNEALSATWEHIDRENKVWRIPASNSKSKKVRSVPLNESALEVLDQLGTEGKHDHLFVSGKTGAKLVFVRKSWDRIRVLAELPHLRIHDLRHQYASFLVNSGRSLYEVQKILGHSSHSVTERYAHLSSRSLMDAANTASVMIKGASAAATTEVATTAVQEAATTAA